MPNPQGQVSPQQMLAHLQQVLRHQESEITRNRQRVAALEARITLSERGLKPRFPVEFRSQFGEDVWVWDVLGGQTEGFFIEVGAFDGYHYSVTYALEAMGWNGLLIEALPDAAEACRKRRVHSRVVRSALGRRGASGTVKFVSVKDQYGGMLSYAEGPSDHARKIADGKFQTRTIEAPVTCLDQLLGEHTGAVDVAVIDVEGAELDVLNGFDLDRWKPRLLLIEDNTMGRNPALGQYMSIKPYTFAGWLAVNRLYVRGDEAGLLDRLKPY